MYNSNSIYVQFDGMVYKQIVGIPMGTNCAPLIADFFLYCYERGFMSDLQKSKSFDLIDMFNDTSRYLDDIFTIDNPEFEKHISDIYPAELKLNKENTSDKETGTRTTRQSASNLLFIPRARTEYHKRSFTISAVSMWNNLPEFIRNCSNLSFFKTSYLENYFNAH